MNKVFFASLILIVSTQSRASFVRSVRRITSITKQTSRFLTITLPRPLLHPQTSEQALQQAIEKNNLKTIKLLISYNIKNLESENIYGQTPLEEAILFNQNHVIDLLCKEGANPFPKRNRIFKAWRIATFISASNINNWFHLADQFAPNYMPAIGCAAANLIACLIAEPLSYIKNDPLANTTWGTEEGRNTKLNVWRHRFLYLFRKAKSFF